MVAVVEDDRRAVQRLRHVEAHDAVQRAQVVVPAERELLPGQRAKVNDVARSVRVALRESDRLVSEHFPLQSTIGMLL